MSSNWYSVAETWLKGGVELEELVIEAGLEGQLSELFKFLKEHPCDSGPKSISLESLHKYACQCAYDLLSSQDADRAIQLIKNIRGSESLERWLNDALMSTLDFPVRKKLEEYLRSYGLLSAQDENVLMKLESLSRVYPNDKYEIALGKCQALSRPVDTYNKTVIGNCLRKSLKLEFEELELTDEIQGISVLSENGNLWANVSDINEDWGEPNNEFFSARSDRRMHSRPLLTSPLYFRAAANWFRAVREIDIERITFEGELLSEHLTGVKSQNSLLLNMQSKWRAELLYNISHHLFDRVLEMLNEVPVGCRSPGTLRVFEEGTEKEILTVAIETINFDVSSACSEEMRRVVEEKFLTKGIWLKTKWENIQSWLGLMSKTNMFLGTSPLSKEVKEMLGSESVACLVIGYCVKNNLSRVLQSYLDNYSSSLSAGIPILLAMLRAAKDCHWAHWLILNRIPGHAFAANIANASFILGNTKIRSLEELAQKGTVHMVLSAIANSPVSLTETLMPGSELKKINFNEEDFLIINNSLCNVAPYCELSSLEPLLEKYPETLKALLSLRKAGGETKRLLTKAQFLEWRSFAFGVETENMGFKDFFCHLKDNSLRELLEISIGSKEQGQDLSNTGEEAEAGVWEKAQMAKVSSWIDKISDEEVPRGIYIGICHHLICGQPMAALHWFLASKRLKEKEGPFFCVAEDGRILLLPKDLIFLEKIARFIAILFFKEPSVVFGCLVFGTACGFDTVSIKVDAAALQKISRSDLFATEMIALPNEFAQEVSNSYQSEKRKKGGYVASRVLKFLESSCISSAFDGGLDESAAEGIDCEDLGQNATMQWWLVYAFAEQHNLILSMKLLEKLAETDDWISFLAECDAHTYHKDQVLSIAEKLFSHPKLGHHICHVLRKTEEEKEKESIGSNCESDGSKALPIAPKSKELFDILAEAEKTGQPAQVLLVWAQTLSWRILAIIAACYPGACLLNCLTTWLDIGNNLHSSNVTIAPYPCPSSASEEDTTQNIAALIDQVCQLCAEGYFQELLDGLTLFRIAPFAPLSHIIHALKFCTQHMYPAARNHFIAFQHTIDEFIRKPAGKISSTESIRGGDSVAGANQVKASTLRKVSKLADHKPELQLVEGICRAAVFSVLHGLPSRFEREKLIEMLSRIEPNEGCLWLESLQIIRLAYNLLGEEAESYITWSASQGSCVCTPMITDVEAVLGKLQDEGKWMEAREWALSNHLDIDQVTCTQAEYLIEDWLGFDLGNDILDLLWEDVNEIFVEHEYPPLQAVLFFIKKGMTLKNRLSDKDIRSLILQAWEWLNGEKVGNPIKSPTLFAEIRRALYLLDADAESIIKIAHNKGMLLMGSRFDRSPAVQMVLKPAPYISGNAAHSDFCLDLSQESMAASTPQTAAQRSSEMKYIKDAIALLREIVSDPPQSLLQKTIKSLLDVGQIEGAKKMAEELQTPPIEQYLVDTALSVIHICGAAGWQGKTVENIVLGAILDFLRNRGYIEGNGYPSPQRMLDALSLASKEGGGGSVCHRAATTFKTSTTLNISCQELAALGPYKVLELLLLKGPDALQAACDFVEAYGFTTRATAKILAQMYLRGLVWAKDSFKDPQSSSRKLASQQFSQAQLLSNAAICSDWVEIGNALMQLLLEKHSALPSEVEAEVLVLAYRCYEKCDYVEGLDVLLELANSRSEEFAADDKLEALVKLVIGLPKFNGLRNALDLIIERNKLHLLLGNPESNTNACAMLLRSAVLSSFYRRRRYDTHAIGLVYKHFNMHIEVGQEYEAEAKNALSQYVAQGCSPRDPILLDIMDLLISAAAEYSCAQCSLSAARCGALLALTVQQSVFPERQWVCLTDSKCRDLLPKLLDISTALVVARAYNFHTAQDWILTIWQHILEISSRNFKRSSFGSTNKAIASLEYYTRVIFKEIKFTENHIDQIIQMYISHCDQHAAYNRVTNFQTLTKCMIQFLSCIPDYLQRLNLCRAINNETALKPLIKECVFVLDLEEHISPLQGQSSSSS